MFRARQFPRGFSIFQLIASQDFRKAVFLPPALLMCVKGVRVLVSTVFVGDTHELTSLELQKGKTK
jgi:hypothetical protein